MLAVNDVGGTSGQPSHQSHGQQQLIASVVAQQKVIAAQRGADMGDGFSQNMSNRQEKRVEHRIATDRNEMRAQADAAYHSDQARKDSATARKVEQSAESMVFDAQVYQRGADEAQRIVEAQEASAADQKIRSAYIARTGVSDLPSGIRDPGDRVLPKEREGL